MIQLAGLFSLLLLLLLLPLLFFLTHLIFEASEKLPPGPNAWQLLFTISQLRNKPHVAFHNLSKIYGPLFSMRLGDQLLVVASSPATAKAILKTHDRVFSGRFLPSICYAIPEHCSHTRCGRRRTSYWIERRDLVMRKKLQETCLGMRAGETAKMVKDLVDEIGKMMATPGLVDLFPVLRRVDFWGKRDGKILQRKVMCVWEGILKERRSRNGSSDNGRDFLDVLLENAFPDDHTCFVLMV
ncbi:UNVERIFIED_CONTAM: putative (S)-N-methylcoclaurine 3'-hydroxylase isozyme 2 [Sesamum radiatum]|uniref:(S)-N-methylcoclaurine 3'-hydroxylase isozyme 2 n=1 Tax=Sesamum radiatum TaxID=300843 RepID=A0AAW2NCG6_SESRA